MIWSYRCAPPRRSFLVDHSSSIIPRRSFPSCAVRAVAATAGTVDELAGNRRFSHPLSGDEGDAVHLCREHTRNGAPALHFHFNPELVARAYRTPEFRALNAGEYHHFIITIFHFGEQQRSARLRNGLHNQHSRHDG